MTKTKKSDLEISMHRYLVGLASRWRVELQHMPKGDIEKQAKFLASYLKDHE